MNPSSGPPPYPSTMAQPSLAEDRVPGSERTAGWRGSEVDTLLVRRMQNRDERALSEFYERWFPVVNCLVTRIVKSPADAEDVVEETFWQVWRQCDRFETERGSVQTWLLTIARSRSLDRLRASRRRREESIDDAPAASTSTTATQDTTYVDSASDPSLAAEHAERKALVRAALAELPPEQRQALELGYFGGLSQSEIAERTGQPLGTVKSRMLAGLRNLRKHLDEEGAA